MKTITKVIIGLLVAFAAFKMFAGGACSGGTKNAVAPAPVVNNNVQVAVQLPAQQSPTRYKQNATYKARLETLAKQQEEAKVKEKAENKGGTVCVIKGKAVVVPRSKTKARIDTGRRDKRKTGRR